ncbi:MAG: IclR family transcriptional regulator [Desulfitobacteriaceae bacterium]
MRGKFEGAQTGKSEGVQTVEKALTILTTFNHQQHLFGVTELSNKLGLPKSVVHRILISMQKYGFVEKDTLTEKYRLGLRVFELGKVAAGNMNLRNVAFPIIQHLAQITGESILLTIRDGHAGVGIEFVEGTQSMTLKASHGMRLPLHCGASKKILLALQPTDFIEEYFKTENLVRLSDNSPMDIDLLKEELGRIRREGISITADEVELGSTVIAAPIYEHEGRLVAGLGIGGPTFRFTKEKNEEFINLLRRYSREISLKLGYKPD